MAWTESDGDDEAVLARMGMGGRWNVNGPD